MRIVKFRSYLKKEKRFLYEFLMNSPEESEKETHVLQQWTGLKDKNGKDIYEGDIVEVFGTGRCFMSEVIYRNGAFGYSNQLFGFVSFNENSNFNWVEKSSDRIKVIGNIFEHSDLLENKDI